MFERLSRTTVYFRWPLFWLFLIVTLFFARQLPHLSIDPTMDSLFIKNSPEFKYYAQYRERYGSDQMMVIAMATPDLFTQERLAKLENLSKAISEFAEVERVVSLASVMDMKHKMFGVNMVPAIDSGMTGNRSLTDLKADILSNELYVKNLVSADGKHATILVYLKPSSQTKAGSHGNLLGRIRALLDKEKTPEIQYYLAGAPVEQAEFINMIRRDQFLFVPMIVLLLVVCIFWIYQSFICVILAMASVLMTLVWTMGSVVLLGKDLNLVTSLLGPVIMIIAVVNSIHFINLFVIIRRHHRRNPAHIKYAVYITMKQLAKPCFLTHFIAMLGFASLFLDPVPAIQGFGAFASLGTFYSFVIHMVVVPVLLPVLPLALFQQGPGNHWLERMIINFIEHIEFRMRRLMVLITILLVLIAAYGLRMLEVDTSLLKNLKPDSALAKATKFIDDHVTGVYTLAFVFRKKDGQPFLTHEALSKIDRFKSEIEKVPDVRKVNCITSVVKKIHSTVNNNPADYKIPEDDKRIDTYMNEMLKKSPVDTLQWISHDFQELRMEARIRAVGTKDGDVLETRIRNLVRREMEKDFDCEITGNVTLLGRMAKKLVDYQIRGFSASFVAILLLVVLFFMSIRVGLLASIPNLLPIVLVYGTMGFFKIELSMPTAMISGIVLGLVVDQAIHFINRFKMEFKKRQNYLLALHHTYRYVGASLVTSNLILCIGFASSIFASFRPTVHFGVLTALTIFIALFCTLIIMPVFLVWIRPFGPPRLFK